MERINKHYLRKMKGMDKKALEDKLVSLSTKREAVLEEGKPRIKFN